MSEKILLQILAEIKDLRTDVNDIKADITGIKSEMNDMKADITGMKAQLDANTQIIKVIRDHQEETDIQPTNLSPDIQVIQNDLVTLTKIVKELQTDLAFTLHKAYTNEKGIFFIRKKKFDNKIS